MGPPPTSYLEVRDLQVHFPTDDGLVKSVDGLSFALDRSNHSALDYNVINTGGGLGLNLRF